MNFKELIFAAQKGDANAFETIFAMYRPLLMKESIICGVFDEDLFQEQLIKVLFISLEKMSLIPIGILFSARGTSMTTSTVCCNVPSPCKQYTSQIKSSRCQPTKFLLVLTS